MSRRMHMLHGQNGGYMLEDDVLPIHGQFSGQHKFTVSVKIFVFLFLAIEIGNQPFFSYLRRNWNFVIV